MTFSTNKILVGLLAIAVSGGIACTSLVKVDRSKVPDDLYHATPTGGASGGGTGGAGGSGASDGGGSDGDAAASDATTSDAGDAISVDGGDARTDATPDAILDGALTDLLSDSGG